MARAATVSSQVTKSVRRTVERRIPLPTPPLPVTTIKETATAPEAAAVLLRRGLHGCVGLHWAANPAACSCTHVHPAPLSPALVRPAVLLLPGLPARVRSGEWSVGRFPIWESRGHGGTLGVERHTHMHKCPYMYICTYTLRCRVEFAITARALPLAGVAAAALAWAAHSLRSSGWPRKQMHAGAGTTGMAAGQWVGDGDRFCSSSNSSSAAALMPPSPLQGGSNDGGAQDESQGWEMA